MSKGLIVAIVILATALTSEILYTTIPTKIDKDYEVFIYSAEKKPIKEIPVKLKGNKYNGLIKSDYFKGTVEIEGQTTEISSTKVRNANPEGFNSQSYYYATNPSQNSQAHNDRGLIGPKASIVISKDFKTIYGYTVSLNKSYGEGSYFKSDKNLKTAFDYGMVFEDIKKAELYLATMKAAFKVENGGNDFIAVRTESLGGLNTKKIKENVIEGLKELSPNVYDLEQIKGDKTKFEIDSHGNLIRTINGTILSVNLKEYKDNEAIIEAVSWFGNLGAVLPEYKATYKDGIWNLKTIGMGIS